MPDEVVGERLAHAEHRGQPGAERGVLGEGVGEALAALGDVGEAGEGEVGVGRLGERVEERVTRGEPEIGELALGSPDVGETHPGQPPGQGGPRTAHARSVYRQPELPGNTRVTCGGGRPARLVPGTVSAAPAV